VLSDGLRHTDRNGVTDLAGDLDLGPTPDEVVGEPLDSCRLPVGDGPIHTERGLLRIPLGMEIASLLGFEELGSDRYCRSIPFQTPHDVRRPRGLLLPACRLELIWQVEPIASWGNKV